ncbi:acyl-CoA dehydrogenase family member 11-like [Patiria miniata]|uniref:Uncharacterized protein n=1 Tax=Patiria miniata TaxID=46514 RepID=A0A913ZUP2_PATMI|nr:acyl-CoA dehydrogenase family member 11-like [Patiria miniata]
MTITTMIYLPAMRLVRRAFIPRSNVKWMKTTLVAHQMNEESSSVLCKQYHQKVSNYEQTNEISTEQKHLQNNVPFAKALLGSFVQVQPSLDNVFKEDSSLKDYLQKLVPEVILKKITPDLEAFGHRVAHDIDKLGRECELNPPVLQTFDAWGNRTDKLITSNAWKQQKVIAAEEGIVAIPYEQEYGPFSRVYWAAKMLMYNPSSGLFSCPVAMTDGAARFFQDNGNKYSVIKERALPHLTSRNGAEFWTSGQWMTEKRGGSDVGDGTETVAVKQDDGSFKLYGLKWFSSATDSDITLTLARIVDSDGNYSKGTKGISLFYVETRNKDGQLNGIQIQKLKDKLGTRQLPTAELLLDGTVAHLISDEGRGVAAISSMLTITRIHNALSSAAIMRRMVHLARDYSQKRYAFGKLIANHPLHMQTLSRMEVETRGNLLLVLRLCHLLGLEECGEATQQDKQLLRLLTPVAKLYTAKQAIAIASEGLESFGGQGYIEDTGLPVFLRDAQVLSIWEGTTNILSLDVLRSIAKTSGGSLTSFFCDIQSRLIPLVTSTNSDIRWCYEEINKACKDISSFAESASKDETLMTVAARDFATSLARTYIASLLLDHAAWDQAKELDIAVAKRWCEQCLCPVVTNSVSGAYTPEGLHHDAHIVMDGYSTSQM